MSKTNLPPPPFRAVLTLSASSVIEAPVEKVWEVLVDFPKYGEWNDMVHAQTIVDKDKKPIEDQKPRKGQNLLMEVHIPPTPDKSKKPTYAHELITAVDDIERRVCWISLYPKWFIEAVRWQAVSPVEGEEGKTIYESRETFRGIGAYIIRWFLAGGLQKGFDAAASGLKRRAEQLQG